MRPRRPVAWRKAAGGRPPAADQTKLNNIMALASGESPRGILRKLRQLDDDRR